uniref:MRG domain-containing protein n=1 Tax=Rhabditophanes sp. KR3021 TaxID=114890 RepID=A0AC35U0B8_9BILA
MDNILAKWQGEFKAVYGRGPKKEDYTIAPAPVKKLYDDKLGNNRIKRQVKRKHIDEEQRVVNLPECYNIRQDTSEPSIKRPKQDVKDDFKLEDIKENNVLSEHSSPDRRWGLPLNSKTLLMRTPVMSRVREDTAEAPPTPSPNKKFTSRKQGRNLTKLYANINLMLDSPKKAPESGRLDMSDVVRYLVSYLFEKLLNRHLFVDAE